MSDHSALNDVLTDVSREYDAARAKHGEWTLDGSASSDLRRLAALMEEVGEVAEHLTYDKTTEDREPLYRELIQVANVSATWAAYLLTQGAESPLGFMHSSSVCDTMEPQEDGGDGR